MGQGQKEGAREEKEGGREGGSGPDMLVSGQVTLEPRGSRTGAQA